MVTAPIAKAPLYAAGFRFPGHTEFLADLTADAPMAGERGPVMMLASGDLRTVLVTIHEPYARRRACSASIASSMWRRSRPRPWRATSA